MKVTILGSGTAVPSLKRNSAAVLLQYDAVNCLVDFGYGTVHQLLRLGLTYHDIHRVFFTHNHPDHLCDLIPFLFATKYHEDPRTRNLGIVGAPGFKKFYEGLTDQFQHWLTPDRYRVELVEQDEETLTYDGLSVTTRKVKHMELSRGYRFTSPGGQTVAVSGDTDYCEEMIELGKNTDLMVLECSFPDSMKMAGHLTPLEAGWLARKAECKKLCLTHFYPPCDLEEVRKVCAQEYDGKIYLAEDLMTFEL